MAYNPNNPNGQAVMASSAPVVIASDQSTIPTKGSFTEQASLSAGSLNADLVPSTDVSAYKMASLHINTNTYSGTLTLQGSNDNSTFVTIRGYSGSGGGVITATGSTGIIVWIPLTFRYLRVRMTAYTSGTAQGTLELYTYSNWSTDTNITNVPTVGLNNGTTTGTITTNGSSITSGNTSGESFSLVSIHGTYSGVSFGITLSDDGGNTFYNVPVYDTTANQWLAPGATITPGTNASKLYWVPLAPNASQVKVLASAYTSGTANIRISNSTNDPGSRMSQIMDAAGNNRGANVDSNNNLTVNVNTALPAGTNLLGKVGIDQTTVGTTNAVSLAQIGATTIVTGGVNGTQAIGGNQATNNNVSSNVNPVLIAGSDYGGTAKIQNLKVDSAGVIQAGVYIGTTKVSLNTYEAQITTNTTTTVTASTGYISCIAIAIPTGGTTSTLTIQDAQGTPLKLINALSTTSAITGAPDIYDFQTPIQMTSGISIVTAGAVAATVNVWINYYQ